MWRMHEESKILNNDIKVKNESNNKGKGDEQSWKCGKMDEIVKEKIEGVHRPHG